MTTPQNNGPALMQDFSLEITAKDAEAVLEATANIAPGTRINVTFLGNEAPGERVNTAKTVKDSGFIPVPHLAARRIKSTEEFTSILTSLQEAGVSEHLFLIAGDPATPEGPFEDVHALIKSVDLKKFGVKEVGMSGYPEGHPDISTEKLDQAFINKIAALKDQNLDAVVITQFAFDADAVIAWIRKSRGMGYKGLIRVGTPGPAGVKRLLRYASRFGIASSAGIVRKYGFSLTNLMGTAGPDKFIKNLQSELDVDPTLGPVALHFYTFGGLNATAEWAKGFIAKEGK